MYTIPEKLKRGDVIRVIAPSRSLKIISKEILATAKGRFEELGLKVEFGARAEERDEFDSSSIESRVEDIHAAFADKNVNAVFSIIGGFNSNQLLRHINWDIIRANPKIFIGYSDTTALQNAILAKAGLVAYSGPAYSTFGQKLHFEYTMEYFRKCLMDKAPFSVEPSPAWSDDAWYRDQQTRVLVPNDGYWPLTEGSASGTIIGGNLCTLNLLQGTDFFPDLTGAILFLEDDEESRYEHFDRDLESILSLPAAKNIGGVAIGRFQKESGVSRSQLEHLVAIRPELARIPVVANADFGHTSPIFTFPIGGDAKLTATSGSVSLVIERH